MSEEIVRIVKSETHSEDEDIVIDIDSDREEMSLTKRTNLINALHLNGTDQFDAAPLSPFKPHMSPPDTDISTPEITALGLSGDSVLIKDDRFSHSDLLPPLPNIPEVQKMEPPILSSDDSGFLPSSIGASDLSPSQLLDDKSGAMSAEAKVELLTPITTGSLCRSSSSPDLHYLAGGTSRNQLARRPVDNTMTTASTGGMLGYLGTSRHKTDFGRYTASEGGCGAQDDNGWRGEELDNTEASSGESETDEHPNGEWTAHGIWAFCLFI